MLLVYLTSAVLMLGVIWLIPIVNYASQMFYFGLIVMAVVLGFVVLRRPSREGIFVTLVYALVVRCLIPLSKPDPIIDNVTDVYNVRLAVLALLHNGFLPAQTAVTNLFVLLPGINLLLVSLQLISGIDLTVLLKYLPIFLVLPLFGAIPLAVRSLGIRSERAEVIATAIVVMTPFIMGNSPHTSPPGYGTVLFIIAVAFLLDLVTSDKRQFAPCFVLVAFAVIIYHVTSAFFLAEFAILLSFVSAIPQLRKRAQIPQSSLILLIVLIAVGAFYVSTSPNISLQLVSFATLVFSSHPKATLSYVVPVGFKSLWMIMTEYSAFGLFGIIGLIAFLSKAKDLLLSKLFAGISILIGLGFSGVWLLGFQQGTDLFTRIFILAFTGAAPLMGASIARASDDSSRKLSLRISRHQLVKFAAGVFIALTFLNSVFYGVFPYYYNTSIPLQVEDTRRNLEQWQAFGNFVSLHFPRDEFMRGPQLGLSLVGLYSNVSYYPFVPNAENTKPVVDASLFPYLSVVYRGQYVAVAQVMTIAQEAPGYTPDIVTPSRIDTRLYDNGEQRLLIAIAPERLLPPSNSTNP